MVVLPMLDLALIGKYPLRDFVSSSKCMKIACFDSLGMEMSPFPDISSILRMQSLNREKLVKLSFSVHCFHKVFFEKPSDILALQ